MEVALGFILTAFGAAFGSFLNLLIDRLPRGISVIKPASRCDSCGRRLAPWDMVPILSYLFLKGRCRECGARIPRRVLLTEVITALLFLLSYLRFGLSLGFLTGIFYGMVFLLIIFIDWEHHLILNRITYPAMGAALVTHAVNSAFPNLHLFPSLFFIPSPSILSAIIAGLIGFVFFLIVFLINPRGLGLGDVKLAFLIGLTCGLPFVAVALMLGIIIGGLVAVFLLVTRRKGRKDIIAYGTFLGIGPIVTMLWGDHILLWYFSLF